MANKNISIQSILDMEKWQLIQDKLAVVTGMAIITVDYKGVPVTKHSECSEFCNNIRANPKTSIICQKCDARGGIEAVRLNQSYIYRCHCDIIDVAIPIIVNDKYFGCVMVGQVLLEEDEENEYIEKVYRNSIEFLSDQNKILSLYSKLPHLTLTRIKEIIDLIDSIIKYIVEESITKSVLSKENENMKKKIKRNIGREIAQVNSNSNNRNLTESLQEPENKTSDILKPAIKYINENFNKNITLDDMAKICFVTPGYFSKIFYKETGERFSDCLIRLRIEKAKTLLKTTNKTIQEIAMEVGFNDAGYFTRRFKIYEGTTPGRYKRLAKNQPAKYKIVTKLPYNTTF